MRISTLKALAVLMLALWCTACGPNIYLSQDFRTYATKHKRVAILPSAVIIELRPNQAKHTSAEQMRAMERQSGIDFQEKIFAWLLRRGQKQAYTVEFQDVTQTNALLAKQGINYEDLRKHSPQELSQILGVDAVMTSSVRTSKPMSDGAAVAVGLLVGAWGATNQANITMNIHESGQGKLMWKYDFVASGSVGSSSASLVNALMRNASRKFPYTTKS
ncbi:hypothetical protein EJV47_11490 [Hymenobacter gummosus]|uniref:Lipoprotein n=1 Tax=Hymenobacter gummosus TaxID=1776032 RepID=A0A3S0H780_9BACT|nr:hypothetical protein [Hymenobacter gummosus]RTQ50243.1 hypothetical protein EJV47_11490 [Hymenobacter gummosus]